MTESPESLKLPADIHVNALRSFVDQNVSHVRYDDFAIFGVLRILGVRVHVNTLAPINSLPVELLSAIFHCVAAPSLRPHPITVDDHDRLDARPLLAMTALQIRLASNVCDAGEKNTLRLRRVDISLEDSWDLSSLPAYLQRRAPLIECLTVSTLSWTSLLPSYPDSDDWKRPVLFHDIESPLKALFLSPAHCYENLMQLLASTPMLQYLHITWASAMLASSFLDALTDRDQIITVMLPHPGSLTDGIVNNTCYDRRDGDLGLSAKQRLKAKIVKRNRTKVDREAPSQQAASRGRTSSSGHDTPECDSLDGTDETLTSPFFSFPLFRLRVNTFEVRNTPQLNAQKK
ncbi:hypothetical protein C8Q74DRAFT_1222902 [Fomes fomentarius]|nr:hypothetical protein C8Q74DRAFT_1222902 [Fomes fomentarius]